MPVNDDARNALEQLTAQIITALATIWQRISNDEARLLEEWPALGRAERLARLRQMRLTVSQLMQQADDLAIRFTNTGIPQAYELGGTVLAAGMGAGPKWGQADTDMLGALMTGVRDDLLAATSGVSQSTKLLVRRMASEELTFKATVGQTAVQAGRTLAERLAGSGITAIVYRDGSRHGLDEYSEMVLRTKSAEAYQTAGFSQARAFDVKYMELFDGPGCVGPETRLVPYGQLTHLVRAQFSGRVYCITARTPTGPRSMTVGPNHPVLTARGWIRAHLLTERDQLVYDSRLDHPEALPHGDLEDVPTAADLFESLVPSGGPIARLASADDLHGDGVFCEGEVQVVSPAWRLLVESDPALAKQVREAMLVSADVGPAFMPPPRHQLAFLDRMNAPSSLMGSVSARSPFLGPCPSVPAGQRLATPERPPLSVDHGVDGLGWQVEAIGDFPGGQSLIDVEPSDLLVGQPRSTRTWPTAETALAVVERPKRAATGLADGSPGVGSLVGLAHGMALSPILSIVPHDGALVVYDATTTAGCFNADGFIVKNCGLDSHDDPVKANGLVLPLEEAEAHPLGHPRCVRVSSPRPDIRTAAEARRATGSPSASQNVDQAMVAALRQATAASRADRARRFGRTSAGLLTDSPFRAGSVAAMRHAARVARRAG